MQGLDEYEKHEEERQFIKAMAQGFMDIKEGNEFELDEAKKRLGLG